MSLRASATPPPGAGPLRIAGLNRRHVDGDEIRVTVRGKI